MAGRVTRAKQLVRELMLVATIIIAGLVVIWIARVAAAGGV